MAEVPELWTADCTLNLEVEGSGEPVTVFAHGLTNNADELALFTPMLSGTKVRFDFRGHGRSESPPPGSYRFADFARDLRAVSDAYGATRCVGTSLGAGTLLHLMVEEPGRYDRVVFLLPAGLDGPFRHRERYLPMAEALETKPLEEAIEAILADPERRAAYDTAPWLEAHDRANFSGVNREGVPRAIREVTLDWPVEDRELLRGLDTPALIIARGGDEIHALAVGEIMRDLLPNAELIAYPDGTAMFLDVPNLVPRVAEFLA
ncbi:MAG: alpha/beta hydrolase [Actinobacteria bacterium]|nr:alpha/beta hydrolase [Actinomycetota bacterium]